MMTVALVAIGVVNLFFALTERGRGLSLVSLIIGILCILAAFPAAVIELVAT